ncbi:MAG: class I SAM-dependent methyltransferase [Cucumibacter sp.]
MRDAYDEIRSAGLTFIPHFRTRATWRQLRLVYARTRAHLASPGPLLDWGCGVGHFSWYLARLGFETVGYSFGDSPPLLAGVDNFRHVRGSAAEPTRLPFPDGAFAAVFSIGVLEHVYETGGEEVASLREIARILRPGGLFLCFHFPNRFSWIEAAAALFRVKRYRHRRRFRTGDIAPLCAAGGFTLLERGRYGFFPRDTFGRLPPPLKSIADNRAFVAVLDGADDLLARALPGICQNHYFIARKPGA